MTTYRGRAQTNPSTLHMDGTSPVVVHVQATTDELRALHDQQVELRPIPAADTATQDVDWEERAKAAEAEVERLLKLGQGQRVHDLIERYEALRVGHEDCITVAHQQESELERVEAELNVARRCLTEASDAVIERHRLYPGEIGLGTYNLLRRLLDVPAADTATEETP